MEESKACTKCLQIKPISAFHKLKEKRKAQCAECIKENWHSNKERMNSYSKKSYQKNREKRLLSQKLYALENPEIVKATKRKYLENNPIKRKESVSSYKQRNRESILGQRRNYYGKNSDKWRRYAEQRAVRLKSDFLVTTKEILKLLDKICVYCNVSASVEIDHIIPLAKGGQHRIGNLVGACKQCNRSKSDKFVMQWRVLQIKRAQISL